MRLQPRSFDCCAEECAGRSLAVGARDVEDRRQAPLRIAETGEDLADPLQPERVVPGRKRPKPLELAPDERVVGNGVIGHQRPLPPGERD
jgi:hypothetical protein